MPNIKQTAKQAAISAAKITAREANEFLRTAGEQIIPHSVENKQQEQKPQEQEEKKKEEQNIGKLREHGSFMRDYKVELEQIRKEKLFKELQAKISRGEVVPIENYVNDLTSEQREVLKAMEEAKARREKEETGNKKTSIPGVVSKKGRQMFNMFKKRNEQHVETRQPPSG